MRRTRNSILVLIPLLAVLLFGCSIVDKKLVNEVTSPSGAYKAVIFSIGAGATTPQYFRIYLIRKTGTVNQKSIPICIIKHHEPAIKWLSNNTIMIEYISEDDIEFKVIKNYDFIIQYKALE